MNINLPAPDLSIQYLRSLNARLKQIFIGLDNQSAKHEGTTAPTTGLWEKGNFVWNTNPSELGTGGSKYVITGWVCVTAGEPGAWVESRALTGA
jgi:hypothetical protein